VERVLEWRRRHPGYWHKKSAAREATSALQDLAPSEVVGPESVTVQQQALSRGADLVSGPLRSQKEVALQDLASVQVPLLAGVVS